jgi:hypothetical protein
VRSGRNAQSIDPNYQTSALPLGILRRVFSRRQSRRTPKEDHEITFEGRTPATLFREFAAECMELAQTNSSPEKRSLYMKMASVWHQMAQRWEKKS